MLSADLGCYIVSQRLKVVQNCLCLIMPILSGGRFSNFATLRCLLSCSRITINVPLCELNGEVMLTKWLVCPYGFC